MVGIVVAHILHPCRILRVDGLDLIECQGCAEIIDINEGETRLRAVLHHEIQLLADPVGQAVIDSKEGVAGSWIGPVAVDVGFDKSVVTVIILIELDGASALHERGAHEESDVALTAQGEGR